MNAPLNQLRPLTIPFSIIAGYILITSLAGEFHPFSRFPMFSSFPTSSGYYYVTDENDSVIYGLNKLNIISSEISDMMEVRTKEYAGTPGFDEARGQAGIAVLEEIYGRNRNNPELKKYKSLKIYKREFTLQHGQVVKQDILIMQ